MTFEASDTQEIEPGDRVRFKHDESAWLSTRCRDAGDGWAYGTVTSVNRGRAGLFTSDEVSIDIEAAYVCHGGSSVVQAVEYELVEVAP